MFRLLKLGFVLIVSVILLVPLVLASRQQANSDSPQIPAFQKNPYRFVWFQEEGYLSGMVRFAVDINNDKGEELFLAPESRCKDDNCLFHLFQVKQDRYEYLGTLPLNARFLELLSESKSGFRPIKTYWKTEDGRGVVSTFQFDGEKYSIASTETVEGESSLQPLKIETESSGSILTWRPDYQQLNILAWFELPTDATTQ